MLQTVRDICRFDTRAIDYALSEQIEDLEDLVGHDESGAREFFGKTYVTGGMQTLLRQGLLRLAGKSSQAVFELKQAMGGGKTHSMLALGYLAANPDLYGLVASDITRGLPRFQAKVVAISGRSISRERHLWGDIAHQLGKADAFVDFYKGTPSAPNEKDWVSLIGDEPTLVLLDELPPYFANAITVTVGQGTLATVTNFAISNLLSAALKLPNLCIVISNLSGSYDGATREISLLVQKASSDLQQEAARQAKGITPVELGSDEIYHILRKRLLTADVDSGNVDAVATAYSNAISDAVKAKAVSKSASQIADEIVASYPFHPSFKHILALFKDNERFRQTRGLMTLAAMMVKSVQSRTLNDVYLVGCQHLDLTMSDVRDSIGNIYDLSGAISHDIAGTGTERGYAQVVDEQTKSDAASQIANLLLMASLPEATGAVKGLTKVQLLENLVAPQRSALEFDDAFENLRAGCWYLHRRENEAWYFDRNENLQKKIENYAKGAPQPKIDQEMKRRLERTFEPKKKTAYSRIVALPRIEEIVTSGDRLLIILSPDRKVPPEDAKRLFEAKPEKNNFCIVTGDGSDLAKLEDSVRRIWAIAKVREEDGGDRSSNVVELNEEAESAEFDFNSTLTTLFNRLYFPGRDPKTGDVLRYVALKMQASGKDGKSGNVDGEDAIIEALTSTGASKLTPEVTDGNFDSLRTRIEDLLWVSGSDARRSRWSDIEEQALANVRWVWLPPKALLDVRKRALASGDWRDNGDGYIEKGPFPPPRTSVRFAERDRDDDGKVTLELSTVDAGERGRIHFDTTDVVSDTSPVVPDNIFETRETVLWFLAVDPDGKCPTGPAVRWTNILTLTYQPKEVMGKRTVTLDVKPKGTIRWNLEGTTPREGHLYEGPIQIPGDGEVTIYAYAEDNGISVTKNFTVHAVTGGKPTIDKTKPASLPKKKIKLSRIEEITSVIKAGKATKATFTGVNIVVGTGVQTATTRFGVGTILSSEAIDAFVKSARSALCNETADVELTISDFRFTTGQMLEDFLEQVAGIITVDPSEVDQSEVLE